MVSPFFRFLNWRIAFPEKTSNEMDPAICGTETAVLLIYCPDQKGLSATVCNFIYEHGGNIVHADQHIDFLEGMFFQRVEWELNEFSLAGEKIGEVFAPLASRFQMNWSLHFSAHKARIAVFVSKYDHCLLDLLYRNRRGEIPGQIVVIISNHPDLKPVGEPFEIDFHVFPMTPDNKEEQETQELDRLRSLGVDLIILARYMQILTPRFVGTYPNRIINIHHSFLPAFVGEKPYHRAYQRGVKLIGATCHYVTEKVDDGPIIDQDVCRISHRDSVQDLIRKGRDLERQVLARAVRLHLLNRVLPYGKKTVVFD